MFQDTLTQLFFITVIEIIKFVGVFHEQKVWFFAQDHVMPAPTVWPQFIQDTRG